MTTLTKYYSDTCAPCKAMTPIVSEVLKEFPDLNYKEVNAFDNIDEAKSVGVRNLPGFVLTSDEGKFISIVSGLQSPGMFTKWLNENLEVV